jgi:hypothetical protein
MGTIDTTSGFICLYWNATASNDVIAVFIYRIAIYNAVTVCIEGIAVSISLHNGAFNRHPILFRIIRVFHTAANISLFFYPEKTRAFGSASSYDKTG